MINFTENAENTLDMNLDYIEKHNPNIIKIIREEIIKAIEELPQTHKQYQDIGIKVKFKCMLVHKREFRVVFKVFEEQQLIRIYAILHVRQDIKKWI